MIFKITCREYPANCLDPDNEYFCFNKCHFILLINKGGSNVGKGFYELHK
jgi:hypothetical protein